MLFDLITAAKLSIKIEYPNISLRFLENLCLCSLKIAVCVPKITIISKNCRLKITVESKNCGLKIPVRVYMCARVCAYVCVCMIEGNRTHDQDRHTSSTHPEHTTGTGPPEHTTTGKERTTGKAEKPAYICMFAGNEKKHKKKLRKIWKYEKAAVSL